MEFLFENRYLLYCIAIHSIYHLHEVLLPCADIESILGLAVALQRLEILFPKWGPYLKDDEGKFKQKDLLKEAVVVLPMTVFYSNYLKGIGSGWRYIRELGLMGGFGLFRVRHVTRIYLIL